MTARILVAMCALAGFVPKIAPAQINSGVITGVVTDPQRAVVPKAKVEIVQDEIRVSHVTATNGNGEFTVPYLEAGRSTVIITAPGFPLFRFTNVHVFN